MSPVSVLLLLLGALLMSAAWWLRRASGLPGGEITYADTDKPAEPLISNRYGLVGKPDYVVMQRGVALPVEVKPNRSAGEPYESDRLQVLAYCLLLEETNSKTPPFGVLRYRTGSFRIGYTARERAHLIRLLDEIRSSAGADDVARSHRSPARCASCGFRRSCEQSLAA